MKVDQIIRSQVVRYLINGVVATIVNFGALSLFIGFLPQGMAWFASALASCLGITVSFLGSRYFVFPGALGDVAIQAGKFIGVYGATACLHALVLFIWTDCWLLPWKIGFILATVLQVAISYLSNKYFVFK